MGNLNKKTMSNYNYLFKYIIIGESNFGKSCLMLQYTTNKFKQDNDPTVGVEFGTKSVDVLGKNLKLQIWDTAGQENFRSITRSYFRAAIGAVLTFDLTNRKTFEKLNSFLEETMSNASSNLVIMLVGNKREVTRDEANEFAERMNMLYIEVSAKTGENVQNAFNQLSEEIVRRIRRIEINPQDELGIKLGRAEEDEGPNLSASKKKEKQSGCS